MLFYPVVYKELGGYGCKLSLDASNFDEEKFGEDSGAWLMDS